MQSQRDNNDVNDDHAIGDSNDEAGKKTKNQRKRKKRLYRAIREQMEFYFSDSNLRKDRFLQRLMSSGQAKFVGTEEVALDIFFNFNQIKNLGATIEDLRSALTPSAVLEVSKNGKFVKRKHPVDLNKDFDTCTIYVENLPDTTNHEQIRSLFSHFGNVTYISLPCYPSTHKPKGFSFVEFESQDSVRLACQYFGAQVPKSEKDSKSSSEEKETEPQSKRLKLEEESESKDTCGTKRKSDDQPNVDNKRRRVDTDATETKSLKIRSELLTPSLRVMSKQEWTEWKKKYTHIQKNNISCIKKTINGIGAPPSGIAAEIAAKLANLAKPGSVNPPSLKSSEVDFVKDCILKLTFKTDNSFCEASFRNRVRTAAGHIRLAYIDIPLDEQRFQEVGVERTCYLRCGNSEDAKSLLTYEDVKQLGILELLEGGEEEKYWQRIRSQQQEQKTKKQKKESRKGYHKWVKRAEVLTSHLSQKS